MRQSKSRKAHNQPGEIIFNEDERREYLTGFRKRNLQKQEAKRRSGIEKDKRKRLAERSKRRQALKERAEENARQIEIALGGNVEDESPVNEQRASSGDSDDGVMAYEDGEQVATVTVVEDVELSSLKDPNPAFARKHFRVKAEADYVNSPATSLEPKLKVDLTRSVPSNAKKKKRFRYETKAERTTKKLKELSQRRDRILDASKKQRSTRRK